MSSEMLSDVCVNEKQVAALLGVSLACLRAWRAKGRGPEWLKLSGAVRYRLSAIDRFLRDASKNSPDCPPTAFVAGQRANRAAA